MVLRDLRIFRGTYDEVMAQETENMTFYLAWDTQQLFVGNSLGAKVPYTGNSKTLIQKEFNDFKNKLLKEEITGYITKYFNENEQRILEDIYAKVEEQVADLKVELVNSLDSRSEEIAENTKNKLLNDEDVNTKIEETVKEAVDKIVNENIVAGIKEDVIQEVNTELSEIRGNISEVETNIGTLKTSLNNHISTSKDEHLELENKIKTAADDLNGKLEALETKVDAIPVGGDTSKLNELEKGINSNTENIQKINDSIRELSERVSNNTGKISTIETSVNEIGGQVNNIKPGVRYMTGSELLSASTDLSTFVPTFCTETYGIFKIGKLYYVDGDEIKAMTGGGSGITQQTRDAGFTLAYRTEKTDGSSVSGTQFEIGSVGDIKIIFTINAAYPEACKEITFDGDSISLSSGALTIEKTFNTNSALTKTWILSGIPSDETEEYKYTAASKSVSMTTYIPWLLGNEGNEVHFVPGNRTIKASVTPGLPVYFYANSKKAFKQMGMSVDFDSIEEVSIEINGISVKCFKHTINILNDDTVELEIIDKE